jgi:chemotaxis protein methyltransferase CheR
MATRPPILIVDDTPANLDLLLSTLTGEGYKVLVATDGSNALRQAAYAQPGLILLDLMMPGIDGFETCRRLKAMPETRNIPVIMLTALHELADKVRAFEAGAVDFISKPFQHAEVLARVETQLHLYELRSELERMNIELEDRVSARTTELTNALGELEGLKNRLQAENRYLHEQISEHVNFHDIIGKSVQLQALLDRVDRVAPTDSTVLIYGESGTGKELIARAIHDRSPRRGMSMVKLNCSAISAGLVESELFGHVKGAFTGASERRVGRFELAHQGTLFLDEVSEMPLETQAKLLRVLQEQEFEPVGSSRTQRVDVRVIAATNRNLSEDVAQKHFRADLYYRLNVFPIEVPPLRQRREDIPLLAEHFLERAARRFGKTLYGFTNEAMRVLLDYHWPGNIRELQNIIDRAVILSPGPQLDIDWELQPSAGPSRDGADPPALPGTAVTGSSARRDASLEEVERRYIIDILKQTRGVIEGPRGAAIILGLKPSTARFRIRKLHIQQSEYH